LPPVGEARPDGEEEDVRLRTLVAYFTQTGNTERVAEVIYEELSGDKEIGKIPDVGSLEGYDLAFVGFPIMAFGPADAAKDFLASQAAGKRVALFVTHASPEDHDALPEWLEKCEQAAAGAELVGTFNCQGELAQSIADLLAASDDPQLREFAEARSETVGQPDETRLEKARAFAREMVEKAKA
jgi:flavodoxin